MTAFRRRWVALAVMAAVLVVSGGCVKSGEIGVRNATSSTVLVVAHTGSCEQESTLGRRAWVTVVPGGETKLIVASGSFLGDSCLSVTSFGRAVTLKVSAGRTYEVTTPGSTLTVTDVGKHSEPWYFRTQRWEWSWSSWWVWLYVAPILLGAPVGLYITVRFFYRFYVLKQG